MGITDNLRFGPTSAPWKIGYNSGGSIGRKRGGGCRWFGGPRSGGRTAVDRFEFLPRSAALSDLSRPSAGFPPSPGRTGFSGPHPLVHIGPLARTVGDAALMTAVMAGPHAGDPLSLPDDGVD